MPVSTGKLVKLGVGQSGQPYTAHLEKSGQVSWRVQGIEDVMTNINRELYGMKLRSAQGMKVAANKVLTSANQTSPKVPVDTGELRSSRFVEDISTPDKFAVMLGYDTKYAAAVHEMMQSVSGAPINWKRPGSGPKFFEASLKRNSILIVQTIAKYAEIK